MLEEGKAQEILQKLEAGAENLAHLSEKYHPADIALALDQIQDDSLAVDIFLNLEVDVGSEVLPNLSDRTRELILAKSPAAKLGDIIEEMDSDDAADVLANIDDERAEDIMETVSDSVDYEVHRLMEYPEDTAGGLMQTELLAVPGDNTINEAIEELRKVADELGDVHNIFVVDKNNRLIGVLPLRDLLLNKGDAVIKDVLEAQAPVSVMAAADQEEVAELFKRYDLVSLPVVDESDKLIGRILVDDIVDVLEEEASEDIIKMAGGHEEALTQTYSAMEMAQFRLPWLGASLIGGLATGALLWQFKITLSEALALVAFIPVVMGLSGNVGSQSSALVIRGVATGRISVASFGWYLVKELKIGLALGLICGAVAGLAAYGWHGSQILGIIVAVSLFASIALAALMGACIPLLFRWANIDPAIAGGPIVLAINDISGLLIFFAVANALLGALD